MDALQALYDSQVSEDDAVAVFQCSQQYDEAVDLDESAFRVVSIATTAVQADHEAPRQIEDIRPAQLPNNYRWLAVDLLNAYNAAPRQPAEEREAPRQIEEIVPAEEREAQREPAEEREARARSRR